MLGFELALAPLIIILIEMMLFFAQLFHFATSRLKGENSIRFILLNGFFILYNVTYLINLVGVLEPSITRWLSISTGSLLISYYILFMVGVFKPFKRKVNQLVLFLILLTVSSVFSYFSDQFAFNSDQIGSGSILIPNMSVLVFCVLIFAISFAFKSKNAQVTILRFAVIAVVLLCLSTLPFYFGQNATFQIIFLNLLLIFASVYQLNVLSVQSKNNNSHFQRQGIDLNTPIVEHELLVDERFDLSLREIEMGELMRTKMLFREIGDLIHIHKDTATKHGSTIYKKTNCRGRREFQLKFGIVEDPADKES